MKRIATMVVVLAVVAAAGAAQDTNDPSGSAVISVVEHGSTEGILLQLVDFDTFFQSAEAYQAMTTVFEKSLIGMWDNPDLSYDSLAESMAESLETEHGWVAPAVAAVTGIASFAWQAACGAESIRTCFRGYHDDHQHDDPPESGVHRHLHTHVEEHIHEHRH